MKWLRLSLRYKFIFTLVGFTLIVAVPFGILAIMRFSDVLESQVRVRWETIARFWGEDAFKDLSPASKLRLSLVCKRLLQNFQGEGMLYLKVVFIGEEVCSDHIKDLSPEAQKRLAANLISEGISTKVNVLTQKVFPIRGTAFLDLTYLEPVTTVQFKIEPYENNDGQIQWRQIPQEVNTFSALQLGISLSTAQALARREATLIALVVGGYLVLALIIAFMFYKMILGPAESLAGALQRFKRDPSTRAHIATGDELEMLAREFNAMADALSERNRRLEQMNADLVKANRAKSDFLAVMSHELKTPLHAIRGYSQLLLEGVDGPLTPAQREDLENILNSGDHLLQLIDNILRFSKLEASEDRPYFEAVEASVIGEEAVKAVSALARGKNLELTHRVEPCTLITDGTKLKQALINLLSNAIKYTPAGRVALSGAVRENDYYFSVSDTGVGIPAHERDRIFEPFTQLDSSNTRESHGVGLGLAIVKRYIEMLGGRVLVESEVGRGSVFSIVLPLEPASGSTEKEVSHAHPHR
jgi:signal transduction histidine kinase